MNTQLPDSFHKSPNPYTDPWPKNPHIIKLKILNYTKNDPAKIAQLEILTRIIFRNRVIIHLLKHNKKHYPKCNKLAKNAHRAAAHFAKLTKTAPILIIKEFIPYFGNVNCNPHNTPAYKTGKAARSLATATVNFYANKEAQATKHLLLANEHLINVPFKIFLEASIANTISGPRAYNYNSSHNNFGYADMEARPKTPLYIHNAHSLINDPELMQKWLPNSPIYS